MPSSSALRVSSMRRHGRRLATCVSVGVVLAASEAHADPAPRDVMLAQSLFEEGRRLMEAGHAREACPKFEESQRLDPGGGTLLNLALCREREGRVATALVLFDEAARAARKDGRADRQAIAEEHAAALSKRQARLVVRAPDAPAGLRITVDGAELREPAWGVASGVDPGPHRIEAAAPGYAPFQSNIDIPVGSLQNVDVRLRVSDHAAPRTVSRREKHPGFAPLIVVGSLGLGAAAVGGYVWLLGSVTSSGSQIGSGWESTGRTTTLVGLGAGIPCLVLALVLPTRDVSTKVSVGPNGAWFTGSF